jgi:hypothetical protein
MEWYFNGLNSVYSMWCERMIFYVLLLPYVLLWQGIQDCRQNWTLLSRGYIKYKMEIMSKPPANTENLVYVWVIIIKDTKFIWK